MESNARAVFLKFKKLVGKKIIIGGESFLAQEVVDRPKAVKHSQMYVFIKRYGVITVLNEGDMLKRWAIVANKLSYKTIINGMSSASSKSKYIPVE